MPGILKIKAPAPASAPLSGKRVFFGSCKRVTSPSSPVRENPHALLDQFVSFEMGGTRVIGKVSKQADRESFDVRLAIPDQSGVLLLTDSEIRLSEAELTAVKGTVAATECKVRHFQQDTPFTIDQKMVTLEDPGNKGRVLDYLNVSIEGLASTFKETTPADRDGDYVIHGAFDETLAEFKTNPVMLIDHRNSVFNLAGSYSKVGITAQGLAVRGDLTNAPDLARVRFLIAEKHLKAFSIGGLFLYAEDGRGIQKVRLWEISLVAVPANQDALFQVRSLNKDDMQKMWGGQGRKFKELLDQ